MQGCTTNWTPYYKAIATTIIFENASRGNKNKSGSISSRHASNRHRKKDNSNTASNVSFLTLLNPRLTLCHHIFACIYVSNYIQLPLHKNRLSSGNSLSISRGRSRETKVYTANLIIIGTKTNSTNSTNSNNKNKDISSSDNILWYLIVSPCWLPVQPQPQSL